jgi:hypothetical protein
VYSSGGRSGAVGLPGESIACFPSSWTSCTKTYNQVYWIHKHFELDIQYKRLILKDRKFTVEVCIQSEIIIII